MPIPTKQPTQQKLSIRSLVTALDGPDRPYDVYRFISGRSFLERPQHNPFRNQTFQILTNLADDPLPPGTELVVYTPYQFEVELANGEVTWAVTGGALPGGLTLTPDGLISGTINADVSGTFAAELTATDEGSPGTGSGGAPASDTINIVIEVAAASFSSLIAGYNPLADYRFNSTSGAPNLINYGSGVTSNMVSVAGHEPAELEVANGDLSADGAVVGDALAARLVQTDGWLRGNYSGGNQLGWVTNANATGTIIVVGRWPATGGSLSFIFQSNNNSGFYQFGLDIDTSNRARFECFGSSVGDGHVITHAADIIGDDAWHVIGITQNNDGYGARLYVDGVQDPSAIRANAVKSAWLPYVRANWTKFGMGGNVSTIYTAMLQGATGRYDRFVYTNSVLNDAQHLTLANRYLLGT